MLKDGTLLYHGSYTEVSRIDLDKCNAGLDFGKGFYLTSSLSQATSFVTNSVRRNIRAGNIPPDFLVEEGRVSVYRFHAAADLTVKLFPDADLDWLHFVAANRNRMLFPKLYQALENVDIVGGKIANDNTARTLSGYVTGLFGAPGSALADEMTIRMLLPNRLEDQYCFRTELALSVLEFIGSERYGDL